MKTKYVIVALAGIVSSSIMLVARELRTPLIFQSTFGRAYVHYPIPRPKEDDTRWNFDVIGAAYTRLADAAFTDKQGTKKESLAGLVFGKENFVGKEAFNPGSFDLSSNNVLGAGAAKNPFLNFATISPRFDYSEKGAWFHFTADRAYCGGRWHVGTRINLPFRYIKAELDSCCNLEETLEDVRKLSLENVVNVNGLVDPIVSELSYGYRLDFLASLKTTLNAPFEDVVNFADKTIAGHKIDDTGAPTQWPVHVVFREDGSLPPAPCSLRNTNNSGLVFIPIPVDSISNLNGSGNGVFTDVQDENNSLRARFNSATDYTPLQNNQENQHKLWVVPTNTNDSAQIANTATQIFTTVERIIQTLNTSQVDFFQNQGVSFDTQRAVGAGDLDWDLYAQRQWCDPCWGYFYAEGLVGVRFPTGKRVEDPKKLLAFSTGNNRHFELRAGAQSGWEPREWINMKADVVYSWVLRRKENVAAPFRGAVIKNLGPTVEADVSWNYLLGNVDFTFIAPFSCRAGVNIGYNVYVKSEDDIRFFKKTAVDFLGVRQPLNAEVLEQRTKVVAHKVKTEAFHQGDYWELFGGWSHVVAGKNATRDTDWHIGFSVFF